MAVIPVWRRKGAIFAGRESEPQRCGSGSPFWLLWTARHRWIRRADAAVPQIGAVVVEVVGRASAELYLWARWAHPIWCVLVRRAGWAVPPTHFTSTLRGHVVSGIKSCNYDSNPGDKIHKMLEHSSRIVIPDLVVVVGGGGGGILLIVKSPYDRSQVRISLISSADQMCPQLSPDEKLASEESLKLYCKPIQRYNIIQHRAAKNIACAYLLTPFTIPLSYKDALIT
uniref:Uncharacterized protein n=1 Tax=Triticum turgidum TaxID=4571 RepID=A0A2L1TG11_TRITU|nr:hypothetical protein [Triticum turgidum]